MYINKIHDVKFSKYPRDIFEIFNLLCQIKQAKLKLVCLFFYQCLTTFLTTFHLGTYVSPTLSSINTTMTFGSQNGGSPPTYNRCNFTNDENNEKEAGGDHSFHPICVKQVVTNCENERIIFTHLESTICSATRTSESFHPTSVNYQQCDANA